MRAREHLPLVVRARAARLRRTMAPESTIDVDEHAARIAAVLAGVHRPDLDAALLARVRGRHAR